MFLLILSTKFLFKMKEKCIECKKSKNGVKLRSNDSRTCEDCWYKSNGAAPCGTTGGRVSELSRKVEYLTATVDKQNETISQLTAQLRFVLSVSDIHQDNILHDLPSSEWSPLSDTSDGCSTAPMQSPSHGTKHTGPFTAAVNRTIPTKSCREELLAAVYVEQKDKIKCAKWFTVAGLPENTNRTNDNDREVIAKLCHSELKIMPDIVNAKRVGQPHENKPRLVQVTLKSEEQAKTLIHSAKQLRRSRNDNTRRNVFINPDYTKAEVRANYEIRQKKRQAKKVL